MVEGASLKHIQVEGVISGMDFEDGVVIVQGPDEKYLNSILALCKRRFNQFMVVSKQNPAAAVEALPVREMTHILTDDVEVKEKCSIHFSGPVHAEFEFSEQAGILAVNFTKKELGSSGKKAGAPPSDWLGGLTKKKEEKPAAPTA